MSASLAALGRSRIWPFTLVFKSGPFFLLFKSDRLGVLELVMAILTCTLLVFFKNDLLLWVTMGSFGMTQAMQWKVLFSGTISALLNLWLSDDLFNYFAGVRRYRWMHAIPPHAPENRNDSCCSGLHGHPFGPIFKAHKLQKLIFENPTSK